MRVDKKLNLVVPCEQEGGEIIYFHSIPILKETFQRYSLVIAATFNKLLVNGLQSMGARIAAFTLQEVAEEMGKWEGTQGVKEGLLNEIDRLTNVLVMGANGWESVPVQTAIARGGIDEDDYEEAKQKIVFFILISAMARRDVAASFMVILENDWEMLTTPLNATAYGNSLLTSTVTETLPVAGNQSSLNVSTTLPVTDFPI
jgi:hypothetical protein